MSDQNMLFFMWLRDKPYQNTTRGNYIRLMSHEFKALDLLDRMCADDGNQLEPDERKILKRIRADFKKFCLKTRARKYMTQRFYMKHMIWPEEAYNQFAEKSESLKQNNAVDWSMFYRALLARPAL